MAQIPTSSVNAQDNTQEPEATAQGVEQPPESKPVEQPPAQNENIPVGKAVVPEQEKSVTADNYSRIFQSEEKQSPFMGQLEAAEKRQGLNIETPEEMDQKKQKEKETYVKFEQDLKEMPERMKAPLVAHKEFYQTVRPVDPKDPFTAPVENKAGDFFAVDSMIRASDSVSAGLLKSVEDVANGAKFIANAAEDYFAEKGLGDGKWIDNEKIEFEGANDYHNTSADMIAYSVARYLTPFGLLSRGLQLGGVGAKWALGAGAIGETALTYVAHDPQDELLSNMCVKNPTFKNALCEFLAVEEGDTEATKRAKASAEALLTVGTAGVIGKGLKQVNKIGESKITTVVEAIANGVKKKRIYENSRKVADKVSEIMSSKEVTEALANPTKKGKKFLEETAAKINKMLDEAAEGAPEVAGEKIPTRLDQAAGGQVPLSKNHEKLLKKMDEYKVSPSLTDEAVANAKASKTSRQLVESLKMMDDPAYAKLVDDFKRGVQKLPEMEKKANKILADEKRFMELLERPPGTPINAEEYVALAKYAELAAQRYKKWLDMPLEKLEKLDEVDKIMYLEDLDNFANAMNSAQGGLSEAMRVGRSSREVWQKAAKEPISRLKRIAYWRQMAGPNLDDQIRYAKMASEQGHSIADIAKGKASVRGKWRTTVEDKMYGLFVNGAVAKVGTFFVQNMASNAINTYIHLPMRKAIESFIPGSPAKIQEVGEMYGAYKASFFEALAGWRSSLLRQPVPKKFEGKIAQPPPLFTPNADSYLQKATLLMLEFPTRNLSGGDSFTKIQLHRGSTNAYAYRISQNLKDVSDAERRAVQQKIRMNPPDEVDFAVTKEAKDLTYTNKLEDLTTVPRKVGEAQVALSEMVLGGKSLLPFIGIQANLVDQVIRNSPAALFTDDFLRAMKPGAENAALRSEQIAKVITGSLWMTLGAMTDEDGMIQTQEPGNYREKKATQDPGKKISDEEISIGGAAIRVGALGLPGMLFMLGRDMNHALKRISTADIGKATEVSIQALGRIVSHLAPEAVSGSLKDFVTFTSDFLEGKTNVDKLPRSIGRFATTMTPFRWTYVNAGELIDPVKRDTSPSEEEELDNFFTKLRAEMFNRYAEEFGFSDGLPELTNLLGEPIGVPAGTYHDERSGFFGDSKVEETKEVRDWLQEKAYGLPKMKEYRSKKGMDLFIGMPSYDIADAALGVREPIRLTSKQYAKMIKYINEPINGKTLVDNLKDIKDKEKSYKDDELIKMKIKNLVSQRKSRAKRKIIMETDSIKKRMKDFRRDRMDALRGIGP